MRMQITRLLSQGELRAQELLSTLRLTNAALGESLEQLVRSGLVTTVRKTDDITYRLNSDYLHVSIERLLSELAT